MYRDHATGQRTEIVESRISLGDLVPKDGSVPATMPLPTDRGQGLVMVYDGQLGLEQAAVIGQVLAPPRGERLNLKQKDAGRTLVWAPWAGPALVFPDRPAGDAQAFVALDDQRLLDLRTGAFRFLAPDLPVDTMAPAFPTGGSQYDAYHVVRQ